MATTLEESGLLGAEFYAPIRGFHWRRRGRHQHGRGQRIRTHATVEMTGIGKITRAELKALGETSAAARRR